LAYQSSNELFGEELLLEVYGPMVDIIFENRGIPTWVWKIEAVEDGAQGAYISAGGAALSTVLRF
jgi:hypothetical protein